MRSNVRLLTTVLVAACLLCASFGEAATLGVIGNVSHQPTPGGGNATRVNGDGLVIDNSLNPFVRIDLAITTSLGDHQGVSQIVYDVVSPEAAAKGYFFDAINLEFTTGAYRAWSGFNNHGGPPSLHTIHDPMYSSAISCTPPANYGGGWGWQTAGVPHSGSTSNPGSVLGAGDTAPLTWSGDQDPFIPGIQSFARIGIGQGPYVAPSEDPVLDGQTLGFGTDVFNGIGGGDGSWWFHSIMLDTSGWDKQTYTFNLTTTAGNVLRNDADLSQPLGGGFRQAVTGSDLHGTTISFTLVPEPATLGLLLLGTAALVRRHR